MSINPSAFTARDEWLEDRCGDFVERMAGLRAKLQAVAAEAHKIAAQIADEGGSFPIDHIAEDRTLTPIGGGEPYVLKGGPVHFCAEDLLPLLDALAFNSCDGCQRLDNESFDERNAA